MFDIGDSLLKLFLQIFDLLGLVLVLNSLVTYLLFCFKDFFFDRFLVLLPFLF